jgi:hypothetical protein
MTGTCYHSTVQDTVIYYMKKHGLSKQEAIRQVESLLRTSIPDIIKNLIPQEISHDQQANP